MQVPGKCEDWINATVIVSNQLSNQTISNQASKIYVRYGIA